MTMHNIDNSRDEAFESMYRRRTLVQKTQTPSGNFYTLYFDSFSFTGGSKENLHCSHAPLLSICLYPSNTWQTSFRSSSLLLSCQLAIALHIKASELKAPDGLALTIAHNPRKASSFSISSRFRKTEIVALPLSYRSL